MNRFERVGNKIFHYEGDVLRAVIDVANVAAYREFVPDLPLQPEESEAEQTAQAIPPQLVGHVTLVQPVTAP